MPVRPNAPRVAAEPVELAAVQADGAAQRPSCEPFDEALKAWATSDTQSLVHYLFSTWRNAVREKTKLDAISALRALIVLLMSE